MEWHCAPRDPPLPVELRHEPPRQVLRHVPLLRKLADAVLGGQAEAGLHTRAPRVAGERSRQMCTSIQRTCDGQHDPQGCGNRWIRLDPFSASASRGTVEQMPRKLIYLTASPRGLRLRCKGLSARAARRMSQVDAIKAGLCSSWSSPESQWRQRYGARDMHGCRTTVDRRDVHVRHARASRVINELFGETLFTNDG